MKKVLVSLLATMMVYGMVSAQDLTDKKVSAYFIADESGFSCTDGAVSAFWSDWTGKDYIDLTVDANGWNRAGSPFTGSDDAEMVIKVAYGASGLYMLYEVTDNSYVDAAGLNDDNIDMMIDNLSSADIAAGLSFEMYVQPSWWTVTYTCKQFQIPMGGASAPTTFGYNYYDPGAYAFTFNAAVSIESAPALYNGLCFDNIAVGATQKSQEWFVPWAEVGVGGVPGVPPEGTMFALTGGYNDLDADDATAQNALRWIDRTDPWQAPCESTGEVVGKCDAYGDIEIMAGDPNAAVIYKAGSVAAKAGVVRTEYYTIDGQKLANASLARTGSMIVKRDVNVDGSFKTTMIKAGR